MEESNNRELRNEEGQTLEEFLDAYDENKYPRPSATVDMAVFTLNENAQLSVMLIKRRNHPFIGHWALPGGFVNVDEELEAAAARELEEETGVKGLPMRPYGSFGAVDRDPRTRVITTAFYAVAPMGSIAPAAGDDAADAKLFTINTALEAYTPSAERYRLTLSSDEATLHPRALIRYDELGSAEAMAVPMGKGVLGGDHDLVLFCALRRLNDLPRERVALILSKNDPDRFVEAVRALDIALGAIPESR